MKLRYTTCNRSITSARAAGLPDRCNLNCHWRFATAMLQQLCTTTSLEDEARLCWSDDSRILVSASFSHLAQNYAKWDPRCSSTEQRGRILAVLSQQLYRVLPQSGARELAGILWACAKFEHGSPHLWSSCLQQFIGDVYHAKSQELANVLWALGAMAALQQPAANAAAQAPLEGKPGALAVCVQRFCAVLHAVMPQGIANVLWAMAKLGILPKEKQLQQLLQALASRADADANPHALSSALWALSELQQLPESPAQAIQQQTVERLVAAMADKLSQANNRDISNYLLALPRLASGSGEAATPLLGTQLARKCVSAAVQAAAVSDFDHQQIGNSAWACGALGVYHAATFAALETRAKCVLHSLAPQALNNLAMAAAKLGYANAGTLVASCLAECFKRLSAADVVGSSAGFNHQHLTGLCWAAAVSDLPLAAQPEVARQLAFNLPCLVSPLGCAFARGAATAGGQMAACSAACLALDTKQPAMLPPAHLQQCQEAWKAQLRRNSSTSKFQHKVYSTAKQLQHSRALDLLVHDQQEVFTADGMMRVDVAATLNGLQLAIEADGPNHFTYLDNHVKGDTACRNRALAARGYIVISIPWFEWCKLAMQQQRLAYLELKLQEVVQQRRHHGKDAVSLCSASSSQ